MEKEMLALGQLAHKQGVLVRRLANRFRNLISEKEYSMMLDLSDSSLNLAVLLDERRLNAPNRKTDIR